jgi:hypothetical protein
MTVGLYLILLKIQSWEMKKFSCSTLGVMMKCIENSGLWYRLFLSDLEVDRLFGISQKGRLLFGYFGYVERAIALVDGQGRSRFN